MLQTRKLKIEVKWGQKNELVHHLFSKIVLESMIHSKNSSSAIAGILNLNKSALNHNPNMG